MSEGESRPPIIVRDRRAFTRDGERRAPDPAAPDEEAATDPASESAPGVSEDAPDSAPPKSGTAADRAPPKSGTAAAETDRPRDDPRFQQLVQLLHMQAAMLLDRRSEKGGDAEARRAEILAGLEATIGLLEMLQTKTRNRLGETDARFLSQVLFQLRMAYMEISRAPAGEAAEPA